MPGSFLLELLLDHFSLMFEKLPRPSSPNREIEKKPKNTWCRHENKKEKVQIIMEDTDNEKPKKEETLHVRRRKGKTTTLGETDRRAPARPTFVELV